MKELLKFEFRKLIRNKTFYICLGICALLIIISILINKAVYDSDLLTAAQNEMPEEYAALIEEQKASLTGINLFKQTLASSTSLINNTLAILGIVTSLIICEDFTGDTIKNIYSKGYSRTQVYFAKLISSLAVFLVITIVAMTLSFTLGSLLLNGVGTVGKNFVLSLVCMLFVALAYFMIFFSISMLFKRTAPSIVLCILGPLVVSLIFDLIDVVKKTDKFTASDFWIIGVANNLTTTDVANNFIVIGFIVPIVIIAGFGALSFFLNKKRDAK